MRFSFIICVFFLSAFVNAGSNVSVNGLKQLKQVYSSLVKDNSSKIPLPALVIIDTKTSSILNYEQVLVLLNSTNANDKLDKLPKYLTHELVINEVHEVPKQYASNERYIVVFFNPERYLIKMMEKMLKLDMQELKDIAGRVANLKAVIIYNEKGVYSNMFI